MNITEDYVSFEVAKLLKEKGFDWYTYAYYEDEDDPNISLYASKAINWNKTEFISKPTLQMAMKWLRKTYKIFFNVNYYNLDIGNKWLQLRINRPNKIGCEVSFEGFDLEEQYEKAIKYCLENLI